MLIKVSVRIATYNHSQFIAQAINSVLMQSVNFDYEIIIGEDCSTDDTRKTVTDFQRKYPDKIKLILHKQNSGGIENIEQILKACRGEYIAVLDGDDYWTSPYKLQKQVDFLDQHSECAICFHDAIKFYDDGSREPKNYCPENLEEILTFKDLLLHGNFIPNSSVMYRNSCLVNELPQEFLKLIMGDWPRQVLTLQHGMLGYINEVMAAYRIHQGGLWTRGGKWTIEDHIKAKLAQLQRYEVANKYFGYKYDPLMRQQISDISYFLVRAYKKQENWMSMRKYLFKGFKARPFNKNIALGFLLKSLLISIFPGIYHSYRNQKAQKKENLEIDKLRAYN